MTDSPLFCDLIYVFNACDIVEVNEMIDKNMLSHPMLPDQDYQSITLCVAVKLATRLLRENGMADYEAYADGIHDYNSYYSCVYRTIGKPHARSGGGLSLIVRKSDGLCGMVLCQQDWLYWNENVFLDQINAAFRKHDNRDR